MTSGNFPALSQCGKEDVVLYLLRSRYDTLTLMNVDDDVDISRDASLYISVNMTRTASWHLHYPHPRKSGGPV